MSEESRPEPPRGAPKRKGKAPRKHTVGRVILISAVVLALVTGLSTIYFIRHLNGNIEGVSLDALGDDRPEEVYTGNGQPLDILVMGSDSRDCEGCDIDKEGGGGSDTTILVHLSADRSRAYAVSIPRDSIVDRPELGCSSGGTDVMWNAAYDDGGPVCTLAQLEANTGILVEHFVVVDFGSFGDMVDAVGGVPVCVPEDISDPAHGIFVPKGDPSVLSGDQALDYVRARYVGEQIQQNDISRIRRQQEFIAALVREVQSAGTLTRLDKVVKFLDAATNALTTDDELNSVTRIGKLAMQLRSIGLDKVQFVTLPTDYYPMGSEFEGRVFWTPEAEQIWKLLNKDKEIPARLLKGNSTSAEPPASSSESQAPSSPAGSETSPGESTEPETPSDPETETPADPETETPADPESSTSTDEPVTTTPPEDRIFGVCA